MHRYGTLTPVASKLADAYPLGIGYAIRSSAVALPRSNVGISRDLTCRGRMGLRRDLWPALTHDAIIVRVSGLIDRPAHVIRWGPWRYQTDIRSAESSPPSLGDKHRRTYHQRINVARRRVGALRIANVTRR